MINGKPATIAERVCTALDHPRWRASLIQSTTGTRLVQPKKLAVKQVDDINAAVGQGTFVGASMSDESLVRFFRQLAELRSRGSGSSRPSDVSGMGWSVAQLGSLDGCRCLRASICKP